MSNILSAVLIGRAATEERARKLAESTCPYVGFYAAQGNVVVGVFVLPEAKRWWIEYPQEHPEALGLESATVLITEKPTVSSPWSRGEVQPTALTTPCGTDCLTCPQYRARCSGCPATVNFRAADEGAGFVCGE